MYLLGTCKVVIKHNEQLFLEVKQAIEYQQINKLILVITLNFLSNSESFSFSS